jgi:hypothetical protein
VPQFTYRMAAGSVQEITCSFTATYAASTGPWPITGATWEYVVRETATDTGSPVFSVTTASSSSGLITITDTGTVSQALLSLYPAATAGLTPGTYFHALWMNPSTPGAYAWFSGNLMIYGCPQP